MTLQEKVQHIRNLVKCVKEHPCTFKFYDNPVDYIVILPDGLHPKFDAVRVEKCNNKTKALVRLLGKLENIWDESKL